jgi:hypothetical protein
VYLSRRAAGSREPASVSEKRKSFSSQAGWRGIPNLTGLRSAEKYLLPSPYLREAVGFCSVFSAAKVTRMTGTDIFSLCGDLARKTGQIHLALKALKTEKKTTGS